MEIEQPSHLDPKKNKTHKAAPGTSLHSGQIFAPLHFFFLLSLLWSQVDWKRAEFGARYIGMVTEMNSCRGGRQRALFFSFQTPVRVQNTESFCFKKGCSTRCPASVLQRHEHSTAKHRHRYTVDHYSHTMNELCLDQYLVYSLKQIISSLEFIRSQYQCQLSQFPKHVNSRLP